MSTLYLIGLIIIISFCSNAFADDVVYKYYDEKGNVYFTNSLTREDLRYQKYISSKKNDRMEGSLLTIPVEKNVYSHIINDISGKYGIDSHLISSIIKVESDFNPHAISQKGARGLMQLMHKTAKDMEIQNIFDPVENIEGGTKYLKKLINKFDGDLDLALAAYNAGEDAVNKHGGIPPYQETRDYIKKIYEIYPGKTNKSISPLPDKHRERIYRIELTNGSTLYTNLPR